MEAIAKYIILPSNLITLFFVSGIILLITGKIKRVAFVLLCAAAGIYFFFATGPVSFWLLKNLEYQYPSLVELNKLKEVNTIVILAGYAETDPNLPLSSEVNSPSAFRIIEALRLYRILPDAEILISGQGDVPEIMKRLLVSIGVPTHRIMVESQSSDTHESAVNVHKIVGAKRFVLVTSAGHMPRAMRSFQKLGMKPVPAPTNYMSKKNWLAIRYLPSPLHLEYSDLAVHEYLGILWYRLMNRL